MVVHGRIASTPARRELRIPAPGLHMPSTLIRTWQFEIIPTAVCGGGSSLPERNLIVNHWDEKFSQTDDNALTRTESNPLDGRPNHAVVADGRERILVLAPDQTARGQWLLMASLDVEDGLLLEDALDHPRLATAAAVMNQCRIAANRGGQ